MTSVRSVEDPVAIGNEALARGAWAEARERFETALRREESGEASEGLGWAGWWLADAGLAIRSRERAYRAYRAAGDARGAARVAGWLGADFLEFRGEDAVGRGWLARARRLLDGLPRCDEHGWLALHEGSFALNVDGDPASAGRSARQAARLGRDLGVADLEAVGLALEGITFVVRGRVEGGMRLLDEASAVASGEELQLPVSLGWALCYVIAACEGVGDFPRAVQWCEVMRTFATRWGARQLLGVCRSAYGTVLATGGDWGAAEAELTAAVEDLEASRPGMASGGLVRLAELRALQGRGDEARVLFERAGPHRSAELGLGRLALDAGDAAAAADSAERVLRGLRETAVLDRVPALDLLVRARAAQSRIDDAQVVCGELQRTAVRIGTPFVLGRARFCAGELAAAGGDPEEARRAFEDAVDRFREATAPYDVARARLGSARALAALGRSERAAEEARTARDTFAALGADRDVARAEAPLPSPATGERSLAGLTRRELDVLKLVALGLNDGEIAERLVLSPHTVHRHVANVRAKLGLGSRAAAVAYAAHAGLL